MSKRLNEKDLLNMWIRVHAKIYNNLILIEAIDNIDLRSKYQVSVYNNYENFIRDTKILEGRSYIHKLPVWTGERLESKEKILEELDTLVFIKSQDDMFFFKLNKNEEKLSYSLSFNKDKDAVILFKKEVVIRDKETKEIEAINCFNVLCIYSENIERECFIDYNSIQISELMYYLSGKINNFSHAALEEKNIYAIKSNSGIFNIEHFKNSLTTMYSEKLEVLEKYQSIIEEFLGEKVLYKIYVVNEGMYYFKWISLIENEKKFFNSYKRIFIEKVEGLSEEDGEIEIL